MSTEDVVPTEVLVAEQVEHYVRCPECDFCTSIEGDLPSEVECGWCCAKLRPVVHTDGHCRIVSQELTEANERLALEIKVLRHRLSQCTSVCVKVPASADRSAPWFLTELQDAFAKELFKNISILECTDGHDVYFVDILPPRKI